MTDAENTVEEPQVAPEGEDNQSEQVAETETSANATPESEETPEDSSAGDTEEKLFAGKYKTVEEMEKGYKEAQTKITQVSQEKANLERQTAPPVEPRNVPQLDPDADVAVRQAFKEEWHKQEQAKENRKADVFLAKHKTELDSDKLLDGALRGVFAEARQSGEYIAHEEAFTKAKKLLDDRVKPKIKEAKAQGEEEGREIAKKREQLGAVGQTGKNTKVDPSTLPAEEYAKYLGLTRAE